MPDVKNHVEQIVDLIGFHKQTDLLPTQVLHTPNQTVTPPFGEPQSM
jgi:hypothetical protein